MKGLGELAPHQPGADHRDVVDLAPHETYLQRFDIVPGVKGVDSRVVGLPGERPRRGPGCYHQFVPLEFPLAIRAFNTESLSVGVHCRGPPRREDFDTLDLGEVVLIPVGAVRCSAQHTELFDIAGEHVGQTAGPVGEDLVGFDDGDRPLRLQPPQPTRAPQPAADAPTITIFFGFFSSCEPSLQKEAPDPGQTPGGGFLLRHSKFRTQNSQLNIMPF